MTLDICPLCKNECPTVSRSIVDHKVKRHFKQHIKSHEYGYCENPECDVVYYNNENDEIYFQRDLE